MITVMITVMMMMMMMMAIMRTMYMDMMINMLPKLCVHVNPKRSYGHHSAPPIHASDHHVEHVPGQ